MPQAGASVTVCADGDTALAARTAAELAAGFRARRDDFLIRLPGPEAALREALNGKGQGAVTRPVAVLEPADNPMSGGIGDTPGLFRALLAARPGMNPAARVVFAFFWDPELVARAQAAGPGAALDGALGGRLTGDFGPPVAVRTRVARLTDGRFVNQGPMERGLPVDLGPTAVFELARELGGIEVIVTSACVSPNDETYFALHGIELARLDLLCVKAKNHFRAAFAQSFTRLVDADTPGPAALDLSKLPFRRVPPAHLPPYQPVEKGVIDRVSRHGEAYRGEGGFAILRDDEDDLNDQDGSSGRNKHEQGANSARHGLLRGAGADELAHQQR